eukprot:SAG31_NODE_29049_length_401_cov_1.341060_1_plen_61_part_01
MASTAAPAVRVGGKEIDAELLGTLAEYRGSVSDTAALQRQMREHGYLLLRGAVPAVATRRA